MVLASMCRSGQTATGAVLEFEDSENLPIARWFVCGHVPLLARHENHNHASNSCLTDGGR